MRWKATVAYDGTNYLGWQIQPNGGGIQSVVEKVLGRINKTELVPVTASGRTDAGVHAKGQVFHFDSSLNMRPEQWKAAMNSLLPDDIYIRQVEEVDPGFHARYDAQWKRYDYIINMGEYDPFHYHQQLEYNRRLDIEAMRHAAEYLVGTHDFSAFNANSLEERPNQIRTIYEIRVGEQNDKVIMTFVGNGFLRYMVRMMSGTIMEAGRHKVTPAKVGVLLDKAKKNSVPFNAPARGLYLMEVGYQEYERNL